MNTCFMRVEEYVLEAAKTSTPTKALRSLVARMADAMADAGIDAELVAEARDLIK